MIVAICGAIVALIGLITLVLNHHWSIIVVKKTLIEQAKQEYEDALKSGDTSRITAAMNRINRLQ